MGSIPPRRSPAATFDEVPGTIPEGSVPDDVNLASVKQIALANLNDLQKESFAKGALWRDTLAFTDTFRTFSSADTVVDTLARLGRDRRRSVFKPKDREPRLTKVGENSSWLDIDIQFSIQDGRLVGCCDGTVSVLKDGSGHWKIWLLRTWLECWDGHGHPDHLSPSPYPSASTAIPISEPTHEPYDVIIVGGGQAGLSVAGRAKALGLSHVLFESHPSVGDQWATRYDSLTWHTLRDYSGLPFGYTFPEDVEQMVPTKRIAAGHRAWAERFAINVCAGTRVVGSEYDAASQIWSVRTSPSDPAGGSGVETTTTTTKTTTWRSKNVVLAIGSSAITPVLPSWAHPEAVSASGFKGRVVHSAGYHNVSGFEGARGVVVGVANTGHDVAEDMADARMETTIVQRNPTFVYPVEWLHATAGKDYNRHTSVAAADRRAFTLPMKITREIANLNIHRKVREEHERFDALERVGFKVDRFGDITNNIYVRFGGHYVDTGASKRIASGEIKVKAMEIEGLVEDGVRFEDGSVVGADIVVLATGFRHDFRKDAAAVVGQGVADQMDEFWGIDEEGEIRGNARLAGHPHLYYFGGDTRMARFQSSFVALQIQKESLGVPLQPFTDKHRA